MKLFLGSICTRSQNVFLQVTSSMNMLNGARLLPCQDFVVFDKWIELLSVLIALILLDQSPGCFLNQFYLDFPVEGFKSINNDGTLLEVLMSNQPGFYMETEN